MSDYRILVVDDEPNMRQMLADILSDYQVESAGTAAQGLAMLNGQGIDLLILDLKLPDKSGMEVLAELSTRESRPVVIVITAHGTVDKAVEAMRQGAFDFIMKPFDINRIRLSVAQALEARQMAKSATSLSPRFGELPEECKMVGSSKPLRSVLEMIDKVASTEASVLIRGETGTGKEMVARTIHLTSPRRNGPFISINCAAIPETLLESELFGFEKGAFTGAASHKTGQISLAEGGSLFLDEIGDLSPSSQAKLLRAIEEHEFTPLGSENKVKVDVRVIAATHRDLEQMMQSGLFREDLFFRLNVVPVFLPPLRERKEDISTLAAHFLDKYRRLHGRGPETMPADVMNNLLLYDWPGNARELENTIEKFVLIGSVPRLAIAMPAAESAPAPVGSLKDQARQAEREMIVQTLRETGGNKRQAAKKLGISYKTLFNKLKVLGITVKQEVE